jgi:Cu/Ag efflux pump CusA
MAGLVRTLLAEGSALPWPALVVRAARERFGPTLMSAAMTGMALLPLVLFGGVVGTEIVLPLAVIIWGGLLTSTLSTLFVVPAVLLQFAPTASNPGSGHDTPARTESQEAS